MRPRKSPGPNGGNGNGGEEAPEAQGAEHDPELDALLLQHLEPVNIEERRVELAELAELRQKVLEAIKAEAERPAPVAKPAPPPRPKLRLESPDESFETTCTDRPVLIGRHEAADLMVLDNSISRRHAEVAFRDGAWFIRDLESKSGTRVNGKVIQGDVRLADGDKLQLADASFTIRAFIPPDAAAPEVAKEKREDGKGVEDQEGKEQVKQAEDLVQAASPPRAESASASPRTESGIDVGTHTPQELPSAAPTVPKVRSETDRREGRSVRKRGAVDEGEREILLLKRIGLWAAVLAAAVLVWSLLSQNWTKPSEGGLVRPPPEALARPTTPPAPAPRVATPPATETAKVQPAPAPTKDALEQAVGGINPVPPGSETEAPGPAVIPPATETAKAAQAAPGPSENGTKEPAESVAERRTPAEQLPLAPGALPAEVSPYEPRWFAGPGKATVWLKRGGEPAKGLAKIEKDGLLMDAGGLVTKLKLDDVQQVAWDGMRACEAGDLALACGHYGRAAELYGEALHEAETSVRAGGGRPDFPSRWYLEGRRQECLLKAAHLHYGTVVLGHPALATPEQIKAAASRFICLAAPGSLEPGVAASFDQLVANGQVTLNPEEQARWEELKRKPAVVTAEAKPAPPQPMTKGRTVSEWGKAGEGAKKDVITSSSPEPGSATPAGVGAGQAGPAPSLAPALVTLTCIGGAGDQYINEVGFLPDGTVYGRGTGFMVGYSKDGTKCLGIQGDPNTPGTQRRGSLWANKGSSINAGNTTLTIGYRQVHAILQQPFIKSSAGWSWWGWSQEEAKKRELMADSRGVAVYPLPGGRFLAKCWCDGGNTVLERDPRDLDKPNPALANPYNRSAAGSASLYIIGDARTGEPLHATWMIHRPQAEAVDAYGRVYVAQQAQRKFGPVHKDSLGLGGGAGISVFNPALSQCLFSATLGGDMCYALAVRENMLVIGGSIGQARKDKEGKVEGVENDPAKLPVRNPAQSKPGGGEDGFLAILRLW
jgi:predicted component of type VI protein secretion system